MNYDIFSRGLDVEITMVDSIEGPLLDMEALRQWKIVGSLTAIFIAGAVTGGVITFQVVKSIVRARSNPINGPPG